MIKPARMLIVSFVLIINSFAESPDKNGWYIFKWIEKPSASGPSKDALPKDKTRFNLITSFAEKEGTKSFIKTQSQLREGDVIAYRMRKWQARKKILKGDLSKISYRLLKYGHLAIVIADPDNPKKLRVFSSESFKGPNIRENIMSLATHDWDCYRLDKWGQVDISRLHEFVKISREKAGKWYGYDFSGMFGLWNSNLQPDSPRNIGHDYICSTVVLAALYYSGLELDAYQRHGIADIVTPYQVVQSRGRLTANPGVQINVKIR